MSAPADADREARLLAAARGGDGAAFGELARGLQTRVFRFVLRHVPRPAEAEDLTQDTFLEAFRRLHSFRGDSKFSTWVLGIAFNLARNHRARRPEYRYAMVAEDAAGDLAEPAAGPYERARANDLAAATAEALDTLGDELREALVLVAIDGLGYAEAAEVTGVPLGTVKTRVFRARAALRAHLEHAGKLHLLEP
ncbi:MAG: sigma-70 family RNA polymerase sigma factor [Hyphomicrobiales bacterium]|nr:sigma-70 family RNA polymerase sigma factor [Hyphomicrobiales bacterium]MCP5371165.1 sigma-70 family RNA polymerase sigma factor [Hyphomicrobiales bacterium]